MAKKPNDAAAQAKEDRDALYARTDEAQRIMDEAQPTPTPEELDEAILNRGRRAVAAAADAEQPADQNRSMAAAPDAGYDTRRAGRAAKDADKG